jgi:hypothetical protein
MSGQEQALKEPKVANNFKFNEIKGGTGNSLFISEKGANHSGSMKALEDNGLKALTYQEALPLLMKDEKLKNSLKGKWFYLAGAGTDKDGLFTVDENGELVEKKASPENTVRVWSGKQPFSLVVGSGAAVAADGGRFGLVADYTPDYVAPVVVGVPKEKILQGGTESDKTLAAVQAELRDQEKAIKEKKDKKTALNEQMTALDKEKNALDKEIAEREKRATKLKEVAELLRKE